MGVEGDIIQLNGSAGYMARVWGVDAMMGKDHRFLAELMARHHLRTSDSEVPWK